MNSKKLLKWVVLISVLVLPFLFYFIFVYSAEENFFVTLDYVGPKTTEEVSTAEGESFIDTTYYTVPDWEFTSQHDTMVSADDLEGDIYIASFFFTSCPSICPAMNYNIQRIQNRFINYDNIKIVSFTVDPEHDTVEVLKAYEKKIGANPDRWFFLTGDKEDIYKTAQDYFANAMPDSMAEGGFLHSENIALVDWKGRIRSGRDDMGNIKGVYNGLRVNEVDELLSDIKVLIAEYEKKKSADEHQAEKAEKKDE